MSKFVDLSGQTFGKLKVLKRIEDQVRPNGAKVTQYLCQCSCENHTLVKATALHLRDGHAHSCGCESKNKFTDLTGQTFGRLKVLKRIEDYVSPSGAHKTQYLCECSCENHTLVKVTATHLKSGHTVGCGCVNREIAAERMKVIGKEGTIHGMYDTRLYKIYNGMVDRCVNPTNGNYHRYGGRGIRICPEWYDYNTPTTIEPDKFREFYNWAMMNGYDDTKSIDRIDPNGPYSPDNCRWATDFEQANNTRSNHYVDFNGSQYTVSQVSNILGVNYNYLYGMAYQYGNLDHLHGTRIDPYTGQPMRIFVDSSDNQIPVNAIYFEDQYGRPISQFDYQPPAPRPVCWKVNDRGFITGPCWIDDSDE